MKRLSCAGVRRRLSALVDGELPLKAQIAVEAHLKHCDACMAEAGVLQEVGDTLRAAAAATADRWEDDLPLIQAAVLPRIDAERAVSAGQQLADFFQDMYRLWATGSGVLAGVACGVIAFGMVHVARAQPESLAAVMQMVSRQSVVLAPERIELPRVYADAVMPATVMNQLAGEEAVSTLAAVVMRDGSLSDIELLQPNGRTHAANGRQARLAFDLLEAVSTARFEPGRVDGSPVPFNVVWVLTHTTVRGKAPLRAKAVPPPAPKTTANGVAAG